MTSADIAGLPATQAPDKTHRLVPSRFPPVQTFEDVSAPEDLEAVMALEGWTNDRMVDYRLRRLPRSEWVAGRANASIIMAAFLHAAPDGQRFSGPELGAWYAALELETSVVEVANGLRRELSQTTMSRPELSQTYRCYFANLRGDFADIRTGHVDYLNPDMSTYPDSQAFGEAVRDSHWAGLCYPSVRDEAGINFVAYRPSKILSVTQGQHLRLTVRRSGRVLVETVN